jgi:hypothetical protein
MKTGVEEVNQGLQTGTWDYSSPQVEPEGLCFWGAALSLTPNFASAPAGPLV